MKTKMTNIVIYCALMIVAIIMFFPLFWMLSSSLKTVGQIFSKNAPWYPDPFTLSAYKKLLFGPILFLTYVFNSFKVATLGTIGATFSSALAAFAFARFKFRGRELLFALLLFTLMIPRKAIIVPSYLIIQMLGWVDTHYALFGPAFFGDAFGTFLLRQYFLGIPHELEDSATLDGAGPLRIFWYIYFPLSTPALVTLMILNVTYFWNDLLAPLIYLNTESKFTLAVGLAMLQGSHEIRWNLLLAGSIICIIPILVLYLFTQKYFVKGLTAGALKF